MVQLYMQTNERLEYLIKLFQQLEPEIIITSEFKVRGTSLENLAKTNAGGYQRVVRWAEDKVAELPIKKEVVPEHNDPILEQDMQEIQDFFAACAKTFWERGLKYGHSWKTLSAESTANLIEMKANRATKMGARNAKSLDEAMDMANYAAMLHIKLSKQL